VVHGRKLFIGEPPGRTESCLVGGDETVCTEIPRKEQRVSTSVLEHDAQEPAAIFGRRFVKKFYLYPLDDVLSLELETTGST
jgi:hypothetical protein